VPNSQEDYITYRIERAWKTFSDAKSLVETQSWNSAVNRLYYACFYAVLALFAKYNINSHTHTGVKTQFSLNFIKTAKLGKHFGILYTDLFDFRQKGDYGDFFDFEEKNVMDLIPRVEQFIREIESLTKK
jgi:uncharacterized protein (UPF0332 family)